MGRRGRRNFKRSVLNVARGVAKGAKVAKAGAILTARVTNPLRQAKFVVDALRGKGFVLPGSKYIGPGNEMKKGKPVDAADAAAYQHDVDYDNYMKAGHKAKDVYLGYSDADERLLKKADMTTPNGLAAGLGMLAKKGLHKITGSKRIRDSDKPLPPTTPPTTNSSDVSGPQRQNPF